MDKYRGMIEDEALGEIMDRIITERDIRMTIHLPPGTQEATVEGTPASSVNFFILLRAVPAIMDRMLADYRGEDWPKVIDGCLGLLRDELMSRVAKAEKGGGGA